MTSSAERAYIRKVSGIEFNEFKNKPISFIFTPKGGVGGMQLRRSMGFHGAFKPAVGSAASSGPAGYAALKRIRRSILALAVAPVIVAAAPAPVFQFGTAPTDITAETDNAASVPVDYGYGPGIFRPGKRQARAIAAAQSMPPFSTPAGPSNAGTLGFYGPAVPWPVIPINTTLMPDGRVMNFGTDGNGKQGAKLIYDIWDPSRGLGPESHLTLPNGTEADIFCSGTSLLTGSGRVLVVGGNVTITTRKGEQGGFSHNLAETFTPSTNKLASIAPMQYARWYPTVVSMPSGEKLVLGGRESPTKPAITPEVFNPWTGWRTLTGATSDPAFALATSDWYYPRGFVNPAGQVFILGHSGNMWSLDPTGTGSIRKYPGSAPAASQALPSLMYAPGQILALRGDNSVVTISITGARPVVTNAGTVSQHRSNANATVLADGTVVVTGGAMANNDLIGVAYQNETWNPATGEWTMGAVASKPRLYHSTALLLPDGSVLTGGGGAPGPVVGLNAEIYYPPYLYLKDGSGQPAPRPVIVASPNEVALGTTFQATVQPTDRIVRVAMMRLGSVTHANNPDQSHHQVRFNQAGTTLNVTLPATGATMAPGYYMMFALNRAGVPSIAAIMRVS